MRCRTIPSILFLVCWLTSCGDDTAVEPSPDTGDLSDAGADLIDQGAGDISEDPTTDDGVLDDARDDGMDGGDPDDLSIDPEVLDDPPPDRIDEEIIEFPPGPPEILFTVDELPDHLNGSLPYMDHGDGPYSFTLTLPTHGFTLDLLADRPPAYLDPDSFEVICDQAIGPDDAVAAETDLSGYFEWGPDRIRWLVPEEYVFAHSPVTCRGRVASLQGDLADWSEVTFDTMTQTADLHPFDPIDTWVITFDRDYHDIQFEVTGGGEFVVDSERTPNGESDFLEDLRIAGLQGDESGAGAATLEARGVVGVNAIVVEWIIAESMKSLRRIYHVDPETGQPVDEDSIGIVIFREGEEDAPDPTAWDASFSVHGVGGDAPPEAPTLFGRASAVDYNNRTRQNDSVLGYGTFSTNLVRTVVTNPAGRYLLREILPEYGIPVGEADMDAEIFSEQFDYQAADYATRMRYSRIRLVIELMIKGVSALVAHEMGHSLGLVAPGAPPSGLFGGVYDPAWMSSESNSTHIDTFGLNVMQTGGSLMADPTGILDEEVTFYPLNLAYLRGRVIVLR
ncbi:MAG: hypothetical protein JW797_03750 [Bradymonadales bacterium]|nr:hypothetical protein [Bradymonadales bacterium]